jgi:hypothetical protein
VVPYTRRERPRAMLPCSRRHQTEDVKRGEGSSHVRSLNEFANRKLTNIVSYSLNRESEFIHVTLVMPTQCCMDTNTETGRR